MSEKCFCHLNGYEVKDAQARKDLKELEEVVINNQGNISGILQENEALSERVTTLESKSDIAQDFEEYREQGVGTPNINYILPLTTQAISVDEVGIQINQVTEIEFESSSNTWDKNPILNTYLPIVAGDNVNFTVDEENKLVKINANANTLYVHNIKCQEEFDNFDFAFSLITTQETPYNSLLEIKNIVGENISIVASGSGSSNEQSASAFYFTGDNLIIYYGLNSHREYSINADISFIDSVYSIGVLGSPNMLNGYTVDINEITDRTVISHLYRIINGAKGRIIVKDSADNLYNITRCEYSRSSVTTRYTITFTNELLDDSAYTRTEYTANVTNNTVNTTKRTMVVSGTPSITSETTWSPLTITYYNDTEIV